ncbi:MAG: hypothetical protein GIX03_14900 [Candidatus Eremiobacteraeota bacterium]|nr:hypothetical protein [Candidatus Eremiobacteraeota bacterium]MBC5804253.1 hypothetical protein [Candidatus Eremiobacteraeota bacterium]MBC5822471.1 hypothetical protein [Candidatus Eremiobacteraeota bacterium]
MKRSLVAAALLASVVLPATSVRADDSVDAAFGAKAPAAAPLADAALRDVRGHYIVPQSAAAPIGARALNASAASATQTATAGASSSSAGSAVPGGGNALGGRVVYFGFDLSSVFTTHGPGGATTYSAGEAVGIDLSGAKPVVTVNSYTARGGAAGGSVAGSGSTAGTIADGRIAGVGQTIQIAGNGNTVTNGATVDVSTVRPTLVLNSLSGTACGSPCTVNVDPGALGVAINLPGGQISQGIAGGSVYQAVQLTTGGNAVANQLKLALQVAPGTGTAVTAPVNLIPSTLQLLH